MKVKNKQTEIASSDDFYYLMNFAVITFLLGIVFATPFIMSDSISTKWIVIWTLLAFIPSSFISSFLYFNKTRFYINGIEITYFIRHNSRKSKYIELKDIIAFRFLYTGGRGSGATGILKTYYTANGHNKILRTAMDRNTAAKLFIEMSKQNIILEVVPVWALSNLGFTPEINKKTTDKEDNKNI